MFCQIQCKNSGHNRAYPAEYTESQNNHFNTVLFLQALERLFMNSKLDNNKFQNHSVAAKRIFCLPVSSNYMASLKTGAFLLRSHVSAKDMETKFPKQPPLLLKNSDSLALIST